MSLFSLPVQREWGDIQTIEDFLVAAWPTLIVELGTGTGGFSLLLAGYCAVRGFDFHTFDTGRKTHPHQKPDSGALNAISALGGNVHRMDVFDPVTVDLVRTEIMRSRGPAFVYCDNGDKPKEVETYSPVLRVGDYLGVHDYGTEIMELPDDGFVKWRWPVFESAGSTNRILERI